MPHYKTPPSPRSEYLVDREGHKWSVDDLLKNCDQGLSIINLKTRSIRHVATDGRGNIATSFKKQFSREYMREFIDKPFQQCIKENPDLTISQINYRRTAFKKILGLV